MTLLKEYAIRLLGVATVAFGLAACTTAEIFSEVDTVEQTHFATVAVFDEYDAAGYVIWLDPNTPQEVKDGLSTARATAYQALQLAKEAFTQVVQTREKLKQVEDQSTLDAAVAAAETFRERVTDAEAAVNRFRDFVKNL